MLFRLFFLALLSLVALVWWRGARVREIAVHAARRTCTRLGLQFLDDTVALIQWTPKYGGRHGLHLVRRYRFEFATDGEKRFEGFVDMIGNELHRVILSPYSEPTA
ncbi:MAG: DUF3301 domain-containing protein [Gammaproteobacteria bacterium]|nr:MAG: DUF3301 domain-containing protein [Gammaproteobacteria bacterium]